MKLYCWTVVIACCVKNYTKYGSLVNGFEIIYVGDSDTTSTLSVVLGLDVTFFGGESFKDVTSCE